MGKYEQEKNPLYYIFWGLVSIIAIVEIERIVSILKKDRF